MEPFSTLSHSFNSLSSLISVIINGFLAGLILLINPKETINRWYFLLSGLLAVWSLTMLLADSIGWEIWKILMFQSIPWIGVSAWFFAVSLVNRPVPSWIHGLFTGLAAGLTIYPMIPGMLDPTYHFFPWYSRGILLVLYLTVGSGLALIASSFLRSADLEERRFYRGLMVIGFLGLAGGSSDLIVPGPAPWEMGNVAIALATVGLTWILFRYRFLTIYKKNRFISAAVFLMIFHITVITLAFQEQLTTGWQWFAVWGAVVLNTVIFRQTFAEEFQLTFQKILFPEWFRQDQDIGRFDSALQVTTDFQSAWKLFADLIAGNSGVQVTGLTEHSLKGKERHLDLTNSQIRWMDVHRTDFAGEGDSTQSISIRIPWPDGKNWEIRGYREQKRLKVIPVNTRFIEKSLHVFLPWLRQSETHQQAETKNRLAKIGELALTMAHEIRNPLSSINLAAKNLTPDNFSSYQGIITEEVDRLNHLVESMLMYGRKVKPEITTFKFMDLVNKLTITFPGLEVSVENDQMMTGDPNLVLQVLQNLFVNSREAKADARISISSPDKTRIHVEDNGPGIPADVKDRIFEPFFTTKTTGTGLGLALCRRYLESMNMQIELDPDFTSGTRWIIHTGGV